MSTEHHDAGHANGQPPKNVDVNFEPTDINTRTIILYLLYLALAVAATFLISVYVLRITTKIDDKSDSAPPPVAQGIAPTMPPEPRLQGVPGHTSDPQQDLRTKTSADEAANETLGWVDQHAGIAQIPVDEAMKIIVSKGLPAATAPTEKRK